MVRKANPDEKPDASGAPETSGSPPFEEREQPEAKGKTLYLKLDDQGTPQWSKMTPRTLETWKGVFSHPATGGAFQTEAVPPEDRGAKPADAQDVLGLISAAQAIVLSKMYALSLDDAAALAKFTPEESQNLSPRLARILNKHGGSWIAEYGDECFFTLSLVHAVGSRFVSASALAAQRIQEAEFVAETPEEEKKLETVQ